MIKVILVPVDGTERSAEVLDTALVIAKRFDSHIKVVHVREHASEPYMFGGIPKNYREELASSFINLLPFLIYTPFAPPISIRRHIS